MRFIEDDQFVQAFVAHRFHPAFRIGIRVGCAKWRENDMSSIGPKYGVECSHKLAVVVVNKEIDDRLSLFELPDHLSRLLCDPLPIRMGCTTCDIHPPRLQLNEKQNIDRLQEERFHREEIIARICAFVASSVANWATGCAVALGQYHVV
jgi:hypothetical protein